MTKNKHWCLSGKGFSVFLVGCSLYLAVMQPAYAETTISGTISGNNGEIICVTAVAQLSGSTGCDELDWNNAVGTWSATDGTYLIPNVADGEYYLWFDAGCGDPPVSSYIIDEYWTLDEQGTTDCNLAQKFNTLTNPDTADIIMAAGGMISGTISGTSGQDVCINAFSLASGTDPCSSDWQWEGGGMVAADGSYSFSIPAGSYYLNTHAECTGSNPNNLLDEMYSADGQGTTDCSQATSVLVTTSQTTPNIDIALEQGAVISGTISGTNGQEVCVNAEKLRPGADNNCDRDWVGGGVTAPDGSFTFAVPAGTYFLSTDVHCGDSNSNPGNLVNESWTTDGEGTPYCSNAESFDVSVGANPDKDITLAEGGFISGTITRDPDTGDWNNLRVEFLYDNGEWFQYFADVPVNSDGKYISPPLPTGDFYVQFIDDSSEFQNELYSNVPTWDRQGAMPVAVLAPGTTENINETLQLASADDNRYHPDWAYIYTTHTYDNTAMTTSTASEVELMITHFGGADAPRINLLADLAVTTPSGLCSDDGYYADMVWRFRQDDNNQNGIIDADEERLPGIFTEFAKTCNLGSSPHVAGTYTFQATLPDATVLTKTLTGVTAGLTASQLPPVTGLTANWNSPSADELTISWTLPGSAYPENSYFEVRIYPYKNGTFTNTQIRMGNLPNDLTQLTLGADTTAVFDNDNVDQILVDVRIRKWDAPSMSTTRTRQAYTFDRVADTLTPDKIHMTLLDINGDEKTGLEEAIHSLKTVSGN